MRRPSRRRIARPRLHAEWRHIARHSWSVRLNVLGALFSGLEVVCTVLSGAPPIAPLKFAMIAGGVTFTSAILRLLSQAKLSGDRS